MVLAGNKKVNKTDLFGLNLSMLDSRSVMGFLEWLVQERGSKASTRNQRLYCIRMFFKYMASKNPCMMPLLSAIGEIANTPVVKDEVPGYLSEEQTALILSLPDAKTQLGLRDQAFITVLYDSGARDNEMRSLKLQDVLLSVNDGKLHLIGKRSKVRMTPVSKQASHILKKYLNAFHPGQPHGQDYLFYTIHAGKNCKMSADNSARIMEKYERLAKETNPGIPHLHPHLFRHSRAMHLYQSGMPLELVGQWLGHSQLETTLIYAYADTTMKRKAIEKAMEGNRILMMREEPRYRNDEGIIKKLYGLA